jgi:hypothetical protein
MTKLKLKRETIQILTGAQLHRANGGVWTDTASDGATGCHSEATGCVSWRCTAVACVTPLCVLP